MLCAAFGRAAAPQAGAQADSRLAQAGACALHQSSSVCSLMPCLCLQLAGQIKTRQDKTSISVQPAWLIRRSLPASKFSQLATDQTTKLQTRWNMLQRRPQSHPPKGDQYPGIDEPGHPTRLVGAQQAHKVLHPASRSKLDQSSPNRAQQGAAPSTFAKVGARLPAGQPVLCPRGLGGRRGARSGSRSGPLPCLGLEDLRAAAWRTASPPQPPRGSSRRGLAVMMMDG